MAKKPVASKNVLIGVLGDVFSESYVVPAKHDSISPITYPESMRGDRSIRVKTIRSGVHLHADAIKHFFEKDPRFKFVTVETSHLELPDGTSWNSFDTYIHALGAFQAKETSAPDTKVWRIATTMGLYDHDFRPEHDEREEQIDKALHAQITKFTNKLKALRDPTAVILVLNDRAHRFRRRGAELQQLFLALDRKHFDNTVTDFVIIWHIRNPSDPDNPILQHLATSDSARRRTILIVNHECLRDAGVNLRFDISYERTIQDILTFTRGHGVLKQLLQFAQLMIRFTYGVLHITIRMPNEIAALDVHGLSSGAIYVSNPKFGETTGRTFLLVFALVKELCLVAEQSGTFVDAFAELGCIGTPPDEPSIARTCSIDRAIDKGILLFTERFYRGFGPYSANEKRHDPLESLGPQAAERLGDLALAFCQRCAEDEKGRFFFKHEEEHVTRLIRFSAPPDILSDDSQSSATRESFSRVDMLGHEARTLWKENHKPPPGSTKFSQIAFDKTLRHLVTYGVRSVVARNCRNEKDQDAEKILEPSIWVPYVQCGKHVTFDRDEIDELLSVRGLFESYLGRAKPGSAPLSVGLFGKPGSGKGFVIKEILKSVRQSGHSESLTVNLSQLSSVEELARAFHRIQDLALAKDMPIVFFDEFDSEHNGPLGWLQYFLSPMQDGTFFDGTETFHVGPGIFVFGGGTAFTFQDFEKKYEAERERKAPDFISRLRGHLNVADVSPEDGKELTRAMQVRRALVLRSLLAEYAKNVFGESGEIAQVDAGVLDAFLNVKRFKHGVRSMQAVIEMAGIQDVKSFQRSALPTQKQLAMHVDASEFQDIVNRARV